MRDFIDALHLVLTVWLFFRVYELEARFKKLVEALGHLGMAVLILRGKPPPAPEKKP